MLTVLCKGVIQSHLMPCQTPGELRKPFPDMYPCSSLLRASGYIMVNDVPKPGKLSSPFNNGSLRELSLNTIRHPLYAMDWLFYALITVLALYHPWEKLENSLSNFLSVGLSCLTKPSLERLNSLKWKYIHWDKQPFNVFDSNQDGIATASGSLSNLKSHMYNQKLEK